MSVIPKWLRGLNPKVELGQSGRLQMYTAYVMKDKTNFLLTGTNDSLLLASAGKTFPSLRKSQSWTGHVLSSCFTMITGANNNRSCGFNQLPEPHSTCFCSVHCYDLHEETKKHTASWTRQAADLACWLYRPILHRKKERPSLGHSITWKDLTINKTMPNKSMGK